MCKAQEVSMRNVHKDRLVTVSTKTDTWTSTIYKDYVYVTVHWADLHWKLKHVLLHFLRFATPYNGGKHLLTYYLSFMLIEI